MTEKKLTQKFSKKITLTIIIIILITLIPSASPESIPCYKEINPEESKRSYSSIYNNDLIGVGHARSRLDSVQAWTAYSNDQNQWLLFNLDDSQNIAGLVFQPRADLDQ